MKWFFLVLACLFLYVANEQHDKRDVPNYQNLGLVFLGDLREYNYSVDDGGISMKLMQPLTEKT